VKQLRQRVEIHQVGATDENQQCAGTDSLQPGAVKQSAIGLARRGKNEEDLRRFRQSIQSDGRDAPEYAERHRSTRDRRPGWGSERREKPFQNAGDAAESDEPDRLIEQRERLWGAGPELSVPARMAASSAATLRPPPMQRQRHLRDDRREGRRAAQNANPPRKAGGVVEGVDVGETPEISSMARSFGNVRTSAVPPIRRHDRDDFRFRRFDRFRRHRLIPFPDDIRESVKARKVFRR